jgi:hypothetical protein
LQVDRAGISPLPINPERIAAVLDTDKQEYAGAGPITLFAKRHSFRGERLSLDRPQKALSAIPTKELREDARCRPLAFDYHIPHQC